MPQLLTGQSFSVSYRKQAAIATANSNLWRIPRNNGDLIQDVVTQVDNADSYGLTAPGPSLVIATSLRHAGSIQINRVSAQMAAWLAGFGLSVAPTITGSNPYTHTFKLSDSTNGCNRFGREALYFSAQNKLCSGDDESVDYIGCAIQQGEIVVEGDAVRMACNFVGSGNVNDPASLTTPTANLAEHLLQACNVELTYGSTTHHAAGGTATKIRRVAFRIANELTDEVQPGAGCSGTAALSSGIYIKNTACELEWLIDVYSSAAEKAAAKSAAAASVVLLIPGPSSSHSFQVTMPASIVKSAQAGNTNDYATYRVVATHKADGNNETVNVAAKTTTTNIAN